MMFTADDGQRGIFDAPMLDAYGSGFVTTMWVHFVLSMDADGARVFIDGADVSENLGFPQDNRWIRWSQTPENIAWQTLHCLESSKAATCRVSRTRCGTPRR